MFLSILDFEIIKVWAKALQVIQEKTSSNRIKQSTLKKKLRSPRVEERAMLSLLLERTMHSPLPYPSPLLERVPSLVATAGESDVTCHCC